MTSSCSPLEQDLSCPICLKIFEEPVILSCSHSFCRSCLQKAFKENLERECPICRQKASEEHPLPDLALRNACETYLQEKNDKDSGRQLSWSDPDPRGILCSLHFEKLSLFCLDDQKLLCLQCMSEEHQSHSFCSLSRAASPYKGNLQNHLTSLEKKLEVVKNIRNLSDQEADHIKFQAQNTERQIKEEFEKLHQFLKQEEEARITALREEEKEKSQKMRKKIEEFDNQIQDISGRIRETEENLKEDALFLQDIKRTFLRAQYKGPDPEMDSGALIDVAKHLGNLRYRVWEKMKSISPYFPVILDPNTSNSSLLLSEDLSSVLRSAVNLQLPDNPERMSVYTAVLGSEGFTSGTHSWQVDVEDSEMWIVGVAEESASRKEGHGAVPENGFCCIWRNADVIVAGTSRSSIQTLKRNPTIKKVCVTLYWESGLVTFSNSDNNTNLHTFTYKFTKKMHPYFYNESKNSIKVLPAQISVKQEEPEQLTSGVISEIKRKQIYTKLTSTSENVQNTKI